MELIKKLQNTQVVQKEAFKNLEEALNKPGVRTTFEKMVEKVLYTSK